MIRSEAERERRINEFLSRKFKQFDIEDSESSIRDIGLFDSPRSAGY